MCIMSLCHQVSHLADLLAGDVTTLGAGLLLRQSRLGLVPYHELLPRVDNVYDGARSNLLKVFDVGSKEMMIKTFYIELCKKNLA